MAYKVYELPKYPQSTDMWRTLQREERPIVIYGMGNGADKLISRFEKLNIKFDDIFASDGFVRGHSFHGVRVKSFSEIKELYHDFVIVLSFASNREEVFELFEKLDYENEMYIPDMPVAGEEYFDSNFYNAHYEEILKAYNSLFDEDSRNCFAAVVNYKLFGKLSYLFGAFSSKNEIYELLNSGKKIESYLDGGAYNGDTFKEATEYFKNLKSAILVEPDRRNFKKLSAFSETLTEIDVSLYNAALWSSTGKLDFSSSGNRNSSINSTVSHENKTEATEVVTVDKLSSLPIDYIKYDVEGAEAEALIGSHETILRDKPVLLVSAYHRSKDVFSLINYLSEKYPFYNLYLRRLKCVPAWELDIIAVPKN